MSKKNITFTNVEYEMEKNEKHFYLSTDENALADAQVNPADICRESHVRGCADHGEVASWLNNTYDFSKGILLSSRSTFFVLRC